MSQPQAPVIAIPAAASSVRDVEMVTIGIAVAVYGGYVLLTWFFRELPIGLAAPACAVWLTWHGSLQHETIHGHPTPSRRLNGLLAAPPLSLWIPYGIYRATHLQHHRHGGRHLTEPRHDPESFYVPPGTLSRMGPARRAIYRANCTLAGRLIVGPAVAVLRFLRVETAMVLAGHRRRRILWLRHAVAAALVLVWTSAVCHIPVLVYVMLIVYPSISLTHVRSFAEHRADPQPSRRARTVEANPVWALLFLNNNLHIAHHAYPALAWHRLPQVWRQMRPSAMRSGLVFSHGYRQVLCDYALRPIISVEHPGPRASDD